MGIRTRTLPVDPTVTVTSSTKIPSTVFSIVGSGIVTPTPPAPFLPAYATACSNAARYFSACSCIGQTPTITYDEVYLRCFLDHLYSIANYK